MTEPDVQGNEREGSGKKAPAVLILVPIIFLLLWSSGFAYVKMGLAYSGPITYLTLRFGLVLVVLLPAVLAWRLPLPKSGREWGHLAIVGLFFQCGYFGFLYAAIHLGVSAGTTALIVSLQPILVALLASRYAGERVDATSWAGLVLGVSGAGIVVISGSVIETASAMGVLCAVASLIGITIGTLHERRFGLSVHPLVSSFIQHVVGFAVVLPLGWWIEGLHATWTWEFIWALSYLSFGVSVVSLLLLLVMIRHNEAHRVSSLFFLVAPAAALYAWVLVDEAMSPHTWIGIAVAALGVAIVAPPDGLRRLRLSRR